MRREATALKKGLAEQIEEHERDLEPHLKRCSRAVMPRGEDFALTGYVTFRRDNPLNDRFDEASFVGRLSCRLAAMRATRFFSLNSA